MHFKFNRTMSQCLIEITLLWPQYHHHPQPVSLTLFPEWTLVSEAVEVFIPWICLPRATRNHSPTPKFSGGGQQLSWLVFGTPRRPCPSVGWCSAALIPRPAVRLPCEWRDQAEAAGLCCRAVLRIWYALKPQRDAVLRGLC